MSHAFRDPRQCTPALQGSHATRPPRADLSLDHSQVLHPGASNAPLTAALLAAGPAAPPLPLTGYATSALIHGT